MTPAETATIRQIIREELAAFFAAGIPATPPPAGQVISLERRMEIRRQAAADVANAQRRGR